MDYDELFKVCDNKQYVDINFIMKNNIFFFFFFFLFNFLETELFQQ